MTGDTDPQTSRGTTLDVLVERLEADHTITEQYMEALGEVHASNRRRSWVQFVGTILILIPVIWMLVLVRGTQVDGQKRGKTILAIVSDTHDSAVILRCAVDPAVQAAPEGAARTAAFNECIARVDNPKEK